jgi:iron complex outermembrane receptor protein
MSNFKPKVSHAVATLLAVSTITAYAQTDDDNLEVLIVTGTPGGLGVERLDTGFSITSASSEDITKYSPSSTADLFKTVPGVWSESSGGSSGANVFVRGLSQPGDAPFVTVSINGSPVFGTPSLSFFESSTLFRTDETIDRMEGLRGGPSPVYASGQPGFTSNFILREGSDETEGVVKYTTSDYDLNRIDLRSSGALSDDLYYMIGGYASRSPGVRDAEFTSEKGQQFTINLTKELENGKISVYSRDTNDTGAFYTPQPLAENGDEFPGFGGGTGTYVGNDLRFADIAVNANGDIKTYDLAEGRGIDYSISGLNLEIDIGGGWTVNDNMNVGGGDVDTIAIFNGGGGFVSDLVGDGAATIVSTRQLSNPVQLDSTDGLVKVGFWVVEKEFESFTNDLAFTKDFSGVHQFSFGVYNSSYSSRDFWSLGNQFWVTATTNSQRVAVEGSGDLDNDSTDNGQTLGSFYSINQKGDARHTAYYIADKWFVTDALSVDLGLRWEKQDLNFAIDNSDGVVTLPNGLETQVPDGSINRTRSSSLDDTSFTLGGNWRFNDNMSAFARINTGHLFPTFESTRNNTSDSNDLGPEVLDVDQYEIGYKWFGDSIEVNASYFSNIYASSQQSIVGTSVISTLSESEASGVELDGSWNHGSGFNIGWNLTATNSKTTKSSNPDAVDKDSPRIPKLMYRLSPGMDFSLSSDIDVSLYGTLSYIDDRFSDPANAQTIPSFTKVDMGAIFYAGVMTFQIALDNVTDEVGLTEGNPRASGSNNSGIIFGRPIPGKSVKLSVAYNF